MPYRAEYIWIDGTEPTAQMRSKTKILAVGESPGIWGFDGSSTNQAPGSNSDCVLNPVFQCPDPIRGGDDILVLCEVLLPGTLEPHVTNHRAACVAAAEAYADQEPLFGLEQEYTFFKHGRPLGWPDSGVYYPAPQGPYYCGIGATEISGRDIVEAHTTACMQAGLGISGTNAEVMLGQWEFQIGPLGTVEVADHLWTPGARGSTRRPRPSRPRVTGTAPAATPTSPRTRCARTTTRSSPRARRWAERAFPSGTSRATATATRSG